MKEPVNLSIAKSKKQKEREEQWEKGKKALLDLKDNPWMAIIQEWEGHQILLKYEFYAFTCCLGAYSALRLLRNTDLSIDEVEDLVDEYADIIREMWHPDDSS